MNEDVVSKLQVAVIERVNQQDWHGARTLLEAILTIAGTSLTVSHPPMVEQVPPTDTAPQGTSFDDERMARFSDQPALKNG